MVLLIRGDWSVDMVLATGLIDGLRRLPEAAMEMLLLCWARQAGLIILFLLLSVDRQHSWKLQREVSGRTMDRGRCTGFGSCAWLQAGGNGNVTMRQVDSGIGKQDRILCRVRWTRVKVEGGVLIFELLAERAVGCCGDVGRRTTKCLSRSRKNTKRRTVKYGCAQWRRRAVVKAGRAVVGDSEGRS